eukprot:COSAG06_NODE_24741_length_653_cov_3.638989_1_plen_72_part_10
MVAAAAVRAGSRGCGLRYQLPLPPLLLALAAPCCVAAGRPTVENLGSVDVGNICEQTPVMLDGEMWRFENVH